MPQCSKNCRLEQWHSTGTCLLPFTFSASPRHSRFKNPLCSTIILPPPKEEMETEEGATYILLLGDLAWTVNTLEITIALLLLDLAGCAASIFYRMPCTFWLDFSLVSLVGVSMLYLPPVSLQFAVSCISCISSNMHFLSHVIVHLPSCVLLACQRRLCTITGVSGTH